jgi:hypothetical protein
MRPLRLWLHSYRKVLKKCLPLGVRSIQAIFKRAILGQIDQVEGKIDRIIAFQPSSLSDDVDATRWQFRS